MIRRYFPILLLTFVNVIGFTILIPVLPEIANRYVPAEYTGVAYGALLSSYAMFQFLAAPILGSLSDKYGRKPILLLSQFGTIISWVILGAAYFVPGYIRVFGVGLPLIVIALSRIVDGITGGNISVAQAWASDMSTASERPKTFGYMGATFGIGFLFGPAIGGLSSSTSIGFLGTAITALIVSLITILFIFLGLPESLPPQKRDSKLKIRFWNEINFVKQIAPFRTNRLVMNMLSLRFFFALVFASYTTVVVLLIQDVYGISALGLGLLLTIIGLYSIFNQGFLASKVVKKIGTLNTIYVSIVALIFGLVLLPIIPSRLMIDNPFPQLFGVTQINLSLVLIMVDSYLLNTGISLGQPAFKTLFTNNVAATRQGKITGLDESLLAFGQGVSPMIAGGFYSTVGISVFFVYAIIMTVPTVISYIYSRR